MKRLALVLIAAILFAACNKDDTTVTDQDTATSTTTGTTDDNDSDTGDDDDDDNSDSTSTDSELPEYYIIRTVNIDGASYSPLKDTLTFTVPQHIAPYSSFDDKYDYKLLSTGLIGANQNDNSLHDFQLRYNLPAIVADRISDIVGEKYPVMAGDTTASEDSIYSNLFFFINGEQYYSIGADTSVAYCRINSTEGYNGNHSAGQIYKVINAEFKSNVSMTGEDPSAGTIELEIRLALYQDI